MNPPNVIPLLFVILPVLGIVTLLIGLVARNGEMVIASIGIFGLLLFAFVLVGGDLTGIMNFTLPIYIKIGIGIFTSVVAGLIIAFLRGK